MLSVRYLSLFFLCNIASAMAFMSNPYLTSHSEPEAPPEEQKEKEEIRQEERKEGNKAFIVSDFLYWTASQEGLEYAVSSKADSEGNAHVKDVHFDWAPGYRIGTGYVFKGNRWGLLLNWTRFHDHASASARPSEGRVLTALWIPKNVVSGNTEDAAARWHLQYDLVDLECGYFCHLTSCFAIRPFFGARFANIHEHLRFHYDDVHRIGSASLFKLITHGKNAYIAGGLRAGLGFNFYMNHHWSLYGAGSGSVLDGNFNLKLNFQAPPGAIPDDLGYKKHENRVRTEFEIAGGLQWETGYSDERYHLTMLLCYEYAQWFNQNELVRSLPYPGGSNLILQGGTLRAAFRF